MKLTAHFHLVLRLRVSGAKQVLSLYAFMASTWKNLPCLQVATGAHYKLRFWQRCGWLCRYFWGDCCVTSQTVTFYQSTRTFYQSTRLEISEHLHPSSCIKRKSCPNCLLTAALYRHTQIEGTVRPDFRIRNQANPNIYSFINSDLLSTSTL